MPTYEIEVGGKVYEVDAPSIEAASEAARQYGSPLRASGGTNAGASAQSESRSAQQQRAGGVMTDESGRALAIPSMAEGVALDPSTPEGKINNAIMIGTGLGTGISAAGGVVPFARQALIGAVKSAGGAAVGAKVGGEIGGAFGDAATGRKVGALAGSVAGPMVSTKALMKAAAGGRAALSEWLTGRAVSEADRRAATAVAEHAERRLALEAAKLAEKKAAREAMAQARARSAAIAEERNALMKARLEGRVPARPAPAAAAPDPVPAATVAPAASSPAVAQPSAQPGDVQTIVLQLQQRMSTVDGRRFVRELLNKMPKDQASQIRKLLAVGQAKLPPTFQGTSGVVGGMTRPAGWTDEALAKSAELARMLGQ